MSFKNIASQGLLISLAACGGAGAPTPNPPVVNPQNIPYLVSGASLFNSNCTLAPKSGEINYVNAEVEPFVAVHPSNPKVLLGAWQQDRWNSGGANGLVVAVSQDGGVTWQRKALPFSTCGGGSKGSAGDFERASDPWVDIGSDGTMYAMGLTVNLSGALNSSGLQNAMVVSRSTDQGQTWSTPTVLRGDGADAFNDKNSLIVSPANPNNVYAVWDRNVMNNKVNQGPVWLARSLDGGKNWEPAKQIYTQSVGNALGNRMAVLSDGTLVDVFNSADCDPDAGPSCRGSVQVIRSSDNGVTWSSTAITVSENYGSDVVYPSKTNRLRAPALPSIAVGPGDKIWVTWHDGRYSRLGANSIALSSSTDGGLTWSEPVAINKDTGSHAFMPSITVAKDGTVAVSHYDFRDYASAPSKMLTNTWLLTSKDGQNWTETKIREPFDLTNAPDAGGGLFLGDYQGLVSLGSAFLPFYAQANPDTSNRTDIYAIPITPAPSTVYQARTAPILSTSQKIVLQSRAGLAMQDWMRARMQQRRQP
jgi:Neuraminidase (sialidase)